MCTSNFLLFSSLPLFTVSLCSSLMKVNMGGERGERGGEGERWMGDGEREGEGR